MTVSRFALGLLLISSVNAFWRLPCEKPVLDARVDPIVSPGKPSSHGHTIMGSNAIGYSTTFEDLRNSQCSTCYIKDDMSAYWVPELYYQHKDGSFEAVDHGGMIIYYNQPSANYTAQAFPDGFRMLAGDPTVRSNMNTVESQAITWYCVADQPNPTTPNIEYVQCPYGLRAQIHFPSCWDGVNLDSADHKSHTAYPVGYDNAPCPTSHPVRIITIFYEVWFNVVPFNQLNDGGRFVLANGDPTGYGLHADFMNGWDSSVLSRAISTCTVGDGTLEACPVFENEGRIASQAEMDACSAPNPLPQDVVGPGQLLPNLPGCVAVTEGPAPATPADLVPGCVPAGSASESSTPVPSSLGTSTTTSAQNPTSTSPTPTPVVHLEDSGVSPPDAGSPGRASSSYSLNASSSTPGMSPPEATPASSPTPTDNNVKNSHPSSVLPGDDVKTENENESHHQGHCAAMPHSSHSAHHSTSSMAPRRRHHVKREHESPMFL